MANINNIPDDEFDITFVKSSGKGGQNVNKVSTKAVLCWDVALTEFLRLEQKERFMNLFANRINQEGILIIRSDKHRSQKMNLQECFAKLHVMIIEASYKPKKRIPTKKSKGSQEKRLKQKQRHGEKKRQRQRPTNSENG